MRPQNPLMIEQQRAQSHLATINGLVGKALAVNTPRHTTIALTLKCLHAFAAKQFKFFYNGFEAATEVDSEGNHRGFLDFDPIYPAEYAMHLTAEQVANDVDVILRASSHRSPTFSTTPMQQRLTLADQLAYHALIPAIGTPDNRIITESTVLTYFQKSPAIRMIPYAPVALIGLPLTAQNDQGQVPFIYRDLLAIPHEVGHHVYWRRFNPTPYAKNVRDDVEEMLDKELSSLPDWIRSWKEEIFADIYSCLIAGPVSGLAIQELMKGFPANQSVADHGGHPAPIIRPFIHIAVLEVVADSVGDSINKQQLANAAQALRAAWNEWLNSRKLPLWFIPHGQQRPVTLIEAENYLKKVVEAILHTTLEPLTPSIRPSFWDDLWSKGLANQSDTLDQLIQQFEAFVNQIEGQTENNLPELTEQADGTIQLQRGETKISAKLTPGTTGLALEFEQKRDQALTEGKKPEIIPGAPPWWLPVLEAGFWTTGPGGTGHVSD